MPIKGLTDRGLAFPQIGKIRKGAPKTENAPGKDLSYFRIETDDETSVKLREIYGEQPRQLNIVLAFPDIDRVWQAWEEAYTAGRMVARSDGERMMYWVTPGTGELKVLNGEPETPRPEDGIVGYYVSKNQKLPIKLRPVGRLNVVIPELRRLAYFTVMTTSTYDIINISQQLRAVDEIARRTGKSLAGIPLVLSRRPAQISTPTQDGTRVRREKWLLSVEVAPSFVDGLIALPPQGATLELPAGMAEQGDDEDDEYYEDGYEQPEPQSHQRNRPYAPEDLRKNLLIAAQKLDEASAKEIASATAALEYIYMDKDKKYRVIRWLAGGGGDGSMKDIDRKLASAIHRWLKPVLQDGTFMPSDPYAVQEAKLALDYIASQQDSEEQQTLPL